MTSSTSAFVSSALFLLFVVDGSASAATLSSSQKIVFKIGSVETSAAIKALWDRFGPWCEIAEWHPAVRSCTEGKEGGADFRTLSLKNGGKIKEKLLGSGPSDYRYAIVESPLPVKAYEAQFSVTPDANDKTAVDIVWSATYDAADGKSDQDARAAIDGVFKDGLASIEAKLPKNMGEPISGTKKD